MPDVPALTRGLSLLETVAAAANPPSFVDLWRWSALPKASVARMLACLRERGYLRSDAPGGGYRLGPRSALLGRTQDRQEALGIAALPAVAHLAAHSGHSAIAHIFHERSFTVIASVGVENGVRLAEAGTQRNDLSGGPWGALAWLALAEAERHDARRAMKHGEHFERTLPQRIAELAEHGVVTDIDTLRTGLCRLAAPIVDAKGRHRGSIGLGAIASTINEDHQRLTTTLRQAAQGIAADLAPFFLETTA